MRSLEKLVVAIAIGAFALISVSIYRLFTQDPKSIDTIISVCMLIVGGMILIPALNAYKSDRIEMLSRLFRNAELDIEKYKGELHAAKFQVSTHSARFSDLKANIEKLEGEKKVLLDKSRTVCIHCNKPMFF